MDGNAPTSGFPVNTRSAEVYFPLLECYLRDELQIGVHFESYHNTIKVQKMVSRHSLGANILFRLKT